ncbi:MAG: SDR family NAD(P)-dependent oxidoreductase [Burkholderiales bacterium]
MQRLNGKVALVTGGAGGIGTAICRTLAEHGASVVVGYHASEAVARQLAASLPATDQRHEARAAPVTDSAALHALAADIDRSFGRCDILVNCHGATKFVEHHDLDALDDALIDTILATNVRGSFATVRAMRALLERHGNGLVVNISSISAALALGSNVMYCASKAALDNMTRSLARALAPKIRVVSLSPGLVKTDFVHTFDAAWLERYIAATPLQRVILPEEIGQAVVAIATLLPAVTGVILPVDGGRTLT